MKSFIDNITPDQEKVKKIKSLGKHPFKNVPVFHGGFQNMYHFNFDKTCVKLSALKKLEKYIKYVPLNEISPRLSGRSFFTIACVCDIAQSVLSISDLKNTKFSLLAEEYPTLQKFDMIAFANAEVSITLRIRSSDQIIKIGHCEKVVKCSQCETNHSDKCTTFVDIRNGPTCDFHCHQLVMKSADDRPMLKMAQNQMKFQQDFSPLTSPERIPSVFHGPQIKLPDDYLTKYFENHRGSRLTKISKLINPCKDHKIGVGLNEGDIIVL
ncbi:hypothetical protein M9Y10_002016 [Tritrichomonas musculus]|uniref:Uncharacterized protein n=1 Tax=Tritrichomonas musculus TaxID=1915356 RepID=A0ABR2L8K4_9EUKA